MTFIEKLRVVQEQHDSWLCIGLDPNPEQMPSGVDLLTFSNSIVDATADLACAYKPNLAFYLAYGLAGIEALQKVIAYVPDHIPVILDAKFGDIGYTATYYARAAFEVFKADAVTVTPYVGMDAVMPLLDYKDRMVYVLVRSSNKIGNDFQLWPSKSSPLFRYVTSQINTIAEQHPGQIGMGVTAVHPRDLTRIRCWAPTLPFLIPGIGDQEGDLTTAVKEGITRTGIGPLIAVTRAIVFADKSSHYAEAARQSAEDWARQIRAIRSAEAT